MFHNEKENNSGIVPFRIFAFKIILFIVSIPFFARIRRIFATFEEAVCEFVHAIL